jgi:hypothetical protein
MSLPSDPKQIPATAAAFFQEYNVDLLDINQHAALIIERILLYGNRAEVRWLLETYGRDQVRSWVIQLGMGRLSWRRYHLWCFVFHLPVQKKPARIWPY